MRFISSAVSARPTSHPMLLTSCSGGRSTNGTSFRANAGPRLNDAVWIVRLKGDEKTMSMSLWYLKADWRVLHCPFPFGVRTASRIE